MSLSVEGVCWVFGEQLFEKADRFIEKAQALRATGAEELAALAALHPERHVLFVRLVAHVIMGLGGDTSTLADQAKKVRRGGALARRQIVGETCSMLSTSTRDGSACG